MEIKKSPIKNNDNNGSVTKLKYKRSLRNDNGESRFNITWHACRNILPMKANLFHRKITADNICEVCGNFEQTTAHVLWHCHRAKEMWKEIGLDMDKIMDGCLEFLDLLWYARIVKQWS